MKYAKYIFIILIYQFSIAANSFPEKMIVFPYRVNFQIQNSFPHKETELPILLQDATIFLLQMLYQYDFPDSSFINQNYSEYKEGITELQAKIQIQQICAKNLFSYFIVGESYFYSKNIIKIHQAIFSCRTMQKLYSNQITTNENDLQKDLKNNLLKIIPFLPENILYKKWNSKFSNQNKIFVLVDSSGSMETLFPILKKALNPEIMNIYKIQKENILNIKNLNELYGSGELTTEDLLIALNQIKKELIPFESELWIFFDSFSKKTRSIKELGILFKQLTNQGINIKIFQTYQLELENWIELENFKNFENFEIIPIKYGRICGFSNGYNALFLRYGKNFYLCKEEQEDEFLRGILPLSECPMLEIYQYNNKELNLDVLCSVYANKNKTKFVFGSAVKTDLENIILKTLKKENTNQFYFKVLLKDESKAFWIRLSDRYILNQLLEYKNKQEGFYIGLSFYKDVDGIYNITDKILLPKQKEIPKLFLINFKDLEKRKIIPEDIFFFWVKILDLRYE
jgi:hypothetical protein